jgi:hypothetical protein
MFKLVPWAIQLSVMFYFIKYGSLSYLEKQSVIKITDFYTLKFPKGNPIGQGK